MELTDYDNNSAQPQCINKSEHAGGPFNMRLDNHSVINRSITNTLTNATDRLKCKVDQALPSYLAAPHCPWFP